MCDDVPTVLALGRGSLWAVCSAGGGPWIDYESTPGRPRLEHGIRARSRWELHRRSTPGRPRNGPRSNAGLRPHFFPGPTLAIDPHYRPRIDTLGGAPAVPRHRPRIAAMSPYVRDWFQSARKHGHDDPKLLLCKWLKLGSEFFRDVVVLRAQVVRIFEVMSRSRPVSADSGRLRPDLAQVARLSRSLAKFGPMTLLGPRLTTLGQHGQVWALGGRACPKLGLLGRGAAHLRQVRFMWQVGQESFMNEARATSGDTQDGVLSTESGATSADFCRIRRDLADFGPNIDTLGALFAQHDVLVWERGHIQPEPCRFGPIQTNMGRSGPRFRRFEAESGPSSRTRRRLRLDLARCWSGSAQNRPSFRPFSRIWPEVAQNWPTFDTLERPIRRKFENDLARSRSMRGDIDRSIAAASSERQRTNLV